MNIPRLVTRPATEADIEHIIGPEPPEVDWDEMLRQKDRAKAKWVRMTIGLPNAVLQRANLRPEYIAADGLSAWRTARRRSLMHARSAGATEIRGIIISKGPAGEYRLDVVLAP